MRALVFILYLSLFGLLFPIKSHAQDSTADLIREIRKTCVGISEIVANGERAKIKIGPNLEVDITADNKVTFSKSSDISTVIDDYKASDFTKCLEILTGYAPENKTSIDVPVMDFVGFACDSEESDSSEVNSLVRQLLKNSGKIVYLRLHMWVSGTGCGYYSERIEGTEEKGDRFGLIDQGQTFPEGSRIDPSDFGFAYRVDYHTDPDRMAPQYDETGSIYAITIGFPKKGNGVLDVERTKWRIIDGLVKPKLFGEEGVYAIDITTVEPTDLLYAAYQKIKDKFSRDEAESAAVPD